MLVEDLCHLGRYAHLMIDRTCKEHSEVLLNPEMLSILAIQCQNKSSKHQMMGIEVLKTIFKSH